MSVLIIILSFVNLLNGPVVPNYWNDSGLEFDLSVCGDLNSLQRISGEKFDISKFNPFEIDYLWGWHETMDKMFSESKNMMKEFAIANLEYFFAGKTVAIDNFDSYIIYSKDRSQPGDLSVYMLNCLDRVVLSCVTIGSIWHDSLFGGSGAILLKYYDRSGTLDITHENFSSDMIDADGQFMLSPPETFRLQIQESGFIKEHDKQQAVKKESGDTKKKTTDFFFILITIFLLALLLFVLKLSTQIIDNH